KLAGKLSYYMRGFLIGHGKKTHAAQEDIWKDLRSIAYAGTGDCALLLGDPEKSIPFYQRALHFDPDEPRVHYALALAFHKSAEIKPMAESLTASRTHFLKAIGLNPNLEESKKAKH